MRTIDPEDATVGHSGSVNDTFRTFILPVQMMFLCNVGAVVGEEEVMLALLQMLQG